MPVEVTVNKLLNFQLVNLNINILNNQMQVDQGRIYTKEKRVLHYARTFSSVLNLFGSFLAYLFRQGLNLTRKSIFRINNIKTTIGSISSGDFTLIG